MYLNRFAMANSNVQNNTVSSFKKDAYFINSSSILDKSYLILSLKYIVKDFPYNGITTFVKYLYYFERVANAHMLRLTHAVSSGYNGRNNFSISVYNAKDYSLNNITLISKTQPTMVIAIPNPNEIEHRLVDLTKDNYRLHYIQLKDMYEDSFIDSSFDCYTYESYFKENNTFTETNLLSLAKKYQSKGLLAPYYDGDYRRQTSDLIIKKRRVDDILTSLLKGHLYSLMDEETIIFDNERINIPKIKNPFGNIIIANYMNEKFEELKHIIDKATIKIEDMFGPVRIQIFMNDIEHVARCTFLEDQDNMFDSFPDNRTITVRLSKQECIDKYLLNTIYNDYVFNRGEFTVDEQKALDILNYC